MNSLRPEQFLRLQRDSNPWPVACLVAYRHQLFLLSRAVGGAQLVKMSVVFFCQKRTSWELETSDWINLPRINCFVLFNRTRHICRPLVPLWNSYFKDVRASKKIKNSEISCVVEHAKWRNLVIVAVLGFIYFWRKMKAFRPLEGRRCDEIQFEWIH